MQLTNESLDNIKKGIEEEGAKRILLQVPEGLKMQAQKVAKELEKDGLKVFVSADPCYGACDIRDHEAKLLKCDLLVHIGHTNFGLETDIPVLYEEYRLEANPTPILEEHMDLLNKERIGLATTLQYLDSLEPIKKLLEDKGKKVFLGQPQLAKYPGQVLGCDFSGAKSIENDVDLFLFIGTGMFHSSEFANQTEKPVLYLDLESKTIRALEKERLQRIRFAQIEKAKECQNFGIFVSTKPGQFFLERAEKAKQLLEEKGKNAWIIVTNEISPEKLLGMNIDCIVNCACPRIREDHEAFKKTIINADDVDRI
ncbi:MAG: diphthamide biosynthesis enzyme Dph2 [Nanoarchaeota archaeon]|nr:diphthamide biosynthesis enzyme Dph2 [Nanoarchaeota archaeon]MBU1135655.1 diphthamide biosynthesis enzyme Dph2 [Nanoarchaeota archaeon]MBU2520020.1 diphthamide biosynthesis enzyme Dph2 [Nanoarchaeota archaeon]